MKKIIKALSSVRLAVALILFIAVLGLLGIIIPQAPAAYMASHTAYAWWVDNIAYGMLGTTVYTLEPLGLFKVFHSAWFIGATALLMLNILLCTVSRLSGLRRKAERAKAQPDPGFYRSGGFAAEFEAPSPVGQMEEAAMSLLENRSYSIDRVESTEAVFIAGDKHRLSSWGTLPVHLSLILLILGVVVGLIYGFQDDTFVVSEGTVSDVGHSTGLAVYLDAFTDEYWDDGTPKDYRSDVVILQSGREAVRGTIRVNHPLTFGGVRFHQGYFGQAVLLTITNAAGETVYSDTVPLTGINQIDALQRPEGEATLPDSSYHVIILGQAAGGSDPAIGRNQIGVEFYDADMNFLGWLLLDQDTPQKLGDLSFTYESLQYAGLLVSKNPGAAFAWTAAGLFLLGLGTVFYVPHRKVWIMLHFVSEGSTRISVVSDTSRDLAAGRDMSALLGTLGQTENREGS